MRLRFLILALGAVFGLSLALPAAAQFGGLTPAVELVLSAAREATAATGVGIGVIIASNRTKHPLEARTLARLAARYAGDGVIGFGLSSDERRGAAADFAPAFRIAARAGLLSVPHGGELLGPASVRACLDELHADRIGHGVAAATDRELIKRLSGGEPVLYEAAKSELSTAMQAFLPDAPLTWMIELGADAVAAELAVNPG